MSKRPLHGIRAILAAAAAGGGTVGMEAGAFVAWNAVAAGDGSTALILGLGYLLVVSMMFAPLFLIGLILLGVPMWAVLDGMTNSSRLTAVFAGALTSTATAAAVLTALGVMSVSALWFCTAFGVAGAAAGWTLHRVAYGPATGRP